MTRNDFTKLGDAIPKDKHSTERKQTEKNTLLKSIGMCNLN